MAQAINLSHDHHYLHSNMHITCSETGMFCLCDRQMVVVTIVATVAIAVSTDQPNSPTESVLILYDCYTPYHNRVYYYFYEFCPNLIHKAVCL